MNKFEMGFGIPAENIPKEDNVENKEQENALENINEEFQAIENEGLSSVEDKKTIISRLKKTVSSITAGVMLLSATPAFAQDKNENGQLTNVQKQEQLLQAIDGMIEQQKNYSIDVDPEAQEVLNEWGGKIEGNIIDIGDKKLEIDDNTKNVKIKSMKMGKPFLYIIVENLDGSKTTVTCTDKDIYNILKSK